MKLDWRHFLPLSILLAGLTIYSSCRKIDQQSDDSHSSNSQSNFFTNHASNKPLVQAINQYFKRLNIKSNFVEKTIKLIGYPLWDKAVTINSYGVLHRGASDSTELTYIPFVRENESFVNAALLVQTSPSDTLFKYILDWQYNNAPSGTVSDTTATAEKIAATLIALDNEVFGHTRFRLSDSTLFNAHLPANARGKQRLITVNANNSNVAGRNQLLQTITICVRVQTGGCTCNNPSNCDMCLIDCAWELCLDFEYDDGTGWGGSGGGTGGGSSGGSGGGGGGGGSTPPECPGIPQARNANVTDPCEPGWYPDPIGIGENEFPHNPCKVVDSLMTTPNFPLFYSNLRNAVTLNYENGFMFQNPFDTSLTYQLVAGTPGTLGVDMNPAVPIDGAVHNHYNDSMSLSVFSFDDFYKLYEWFKNGKIANLQTFTFGMVTDSTAYIMMITDSTAFANFGNTFLNDDEAVEDFIYAFYDGYGIHEEKTIAQNEKAFLKALQGLGTGVSLFRANPNLTQFTKIRVNENDQVRGALCN